MDRLSANDARMCIKFKSRAFSIGNAGLEEEEKKKKKKKKKKKNAEVGTCSATLPWLAPSRPCLLRLAETMCSPQDLVVPCHAFVQGSNDSLGWEVGQ